MMQQERRERSAFDINGSVCESEDLQPEEVIQDAPDKEEGEEMQPEVNQHNSLNDTFARSMDPAELAFQRDQLNQIERERQEEQYKEQLEREAGLRIVK